MHSDFRFSIIDAPELITKAEPHVFPAINEDDGVQYKIFPNLGGDALLLSPTSLGGSRSYPSLVDFVKTAPDGQFLSLMQQGNRVKACSRDESCEEFVVPGCDFSSGA
jgi:hypothetical protein